MDQMDLAQIGLRGVLADARAMLDRLAHMRIAGNTETSKQAYAEAGRFAEVMTGARTDANDVAHDDPIACLRMDQLSPNTRLKIVLDNLDVVKQREKCPHTSLC